VVLRDGRVQQIGTPQELHNNPANWHVADFMGYRNLLDVTVDSVSGSEARVSGQGLSLTGTAVHEVRAGDTVRVAIRPHDLVVVEPGQSVQGRNTLEGLVTVVEYQGREFAVGVTTSTGQSLFVTAERAPLPGDRVTLAVEPARALIYQADLTQEDASRPAEQVAVQ
jgi:putative spermidine/putrescine transport system ATP-binding protein